MPYSLGAEVLPEDKDALKEKLEPEAEKKLTADIMDLYDELLPSAESDDRRRQLLHKLEKLFNEQWPGHEIKVHVFGSSGNKLCSSDSDGKVIVDAEGGQNRKADSHSGYLYHDQLQGARTCLQVGRSFGKAYAEPPHHG